MYEIENIVKPIPPKWLQQLSPILANEILPITINNMPTPNNITAVDKFWVQ